MVEDESYLLYEQHRIPFIIIHESRRSVRVAFTSKDITLRLPKSMPANTKMQHIEKSKAWALKQLKAKPGLLTKLFGKTYHHGQILRVSTKTYLLYFHYHDRKTNKSMLKGNMIEIHLSTQNKEEQEPNILRYLIARTIANDLYPLLANRLKELNELHFKRPIKNLKLSLSQTNWGSCSTTGTINLSARLLFAPPEVIDYVIIHELAHLIEHNHSPRFWAVVGRAMPDYLRHDKWLSENSHLCDF
jgi:predicted metal-dependent hydrolase